MENLKKTPDAVQSTISYDIMRNIVTITPQAINGVAVINPVSSLVSVDQWLEIAAKLILGRAEIRAKQAQNPSLVLPRARE